MPQSSLRRAIEALMDHLCVSRLGDLEDALTAIRRWVAAHPDRIDVSI